MGLCIPTHVALRMFIMQVLASQLHFLANRNAGWTIPPLLWPVNCIKIGGHVVLLSFPTVHSLYCGVTGMLVSQTSRLLSQADLFFIIKSTNQIIRLCVFLKYNLFQFTNYRSYYFMFELVFFVVPRYLIISNNMALRMISD